MRLFGKRFIFAAAIVAGVFTANVLFASAAKAADATGSALFGFALADKKTSAPSVAAYKDVIHVAWSTDDGDVYVNSIGADKKVSAPVKVNTGDEKASGPHNSPGIAVGPKGEVYVTWTNPLGDEGFEADIRISVSTDGGASFSKSVVINDNAEKSSRGFESVTVNADGVVHVAWLDGREKIKGKSSAFYASSRDKGKTFSVNLKLSSGVCPCCRTAIVASGKDVYASWRNVSEVSARDMIVSVSHDNGKSFLTPVTVNDDNWILAGCPHRGPSMTVDNKGVLYYTWYSEAEEGAPAVYFAFSTDKGATFSKRQKLPYSSGRFPDHSGVMSAADGAVAVWEEKTPVVSKIFTARFSASSGFSKPEEISEGFRRSSDAALAVYGASIAACWNYDEMRGKRVVCKALDAKK